MDSSRILGRNVIHLIYPIRYPKNTKNLFKNDSDWKNLFSNDENAPPLENYFPSQNEKYDISSIANEQVINYFHPSIQNTLFHQKKDCSFEAYYFKHPAQKEFSARFFKGQKIENFRAVQNEIRFKWIGTEFYKFKGSLGFLVVRLSLNENWFYDKREDAVVPLELWMKFSNRIRQNYQKFEGQEHLKLKEINSMNPTDTERTEFLPYVQSFLDAHTNHLKISSIDTVDVSKGHVENLLEPNAFIHSFAKSNLQTELSNEELYQLIHIDDYEGESGGLPEFQQTFIDHNIYKRWTNYNTYYTAIDYGAMTLVSSPYESDPTKRAEKEFLSDLFYQHHCRHYLLFMILQLYYREELQELTGRYARLDDVESEEAQNVLDDYYRMNQYVFFKRISQEIQGREMWNFYYKIFDIASLMEATKYDMDELKQRRIESYTKKQHENVMTLTVIAGITGFLGMNVLIPKFEDGFPNIDALAEKNYLDLFVLCIPLVLIISIIGWLVMKKFCKWKKIPFKANIVILLLILIIPLIVLHIT